MIRKILETVRKHFRKLTAGPDEEPAQNASKTITQQNQEPASDMRAVSRPDVGEGVSSLQNDGVPRRKPRRRRNRRKKPSTGESCPQPGAVGASERHDPWNIERFEVPPIEGRMRFHDLDLPPEIMHAIADMEFCYCTPIQASLLSQTLKGEDAAGRAQTGTGKTAVFLITIIARLLRSSPARKRRPGTPRALILAPTRELVLQIEKDGKALTRYTPVEIVSVFGGMDYEKQRRQLVDKQTDVVVATPGRLLDFMHRGDLRLDGVEILVIDEADRMLDMGFIPDVQRIIHSTPPKSVRQTMLFSATLTPQITRFSSQWTRDPVLVEVEPEQVAVDTIDQIVYITTIDEKFTLLYNLITKQELHRVIVFCNRRDQTHRLTRQLGEYGISCSALCGDMTQKQRIRTLEDFRSGGIRVLVATDVAARGLHIEGVSHVVNYNLPLDPEDYVHRIGRTGRAGASGTSVSFASEDDSFQLPGIEKYLGRPLPCDFPEDEWLQVLPPVEGNGSKGPCGHASGAPGRNGRRYNARTHRG